MDTRIIFPEDLQLAIPFLKKGGVIAFPTETVYGLGASVFKTSAIEKIFTIKGRPSDNPLIVHISSLNQVSTLAEEVPPSFFRLAERFWPGPLTLVVKRNRAVPSIVSGGHPTIAIRMPINKVVQQLISQLGDPIAAPSANLSGKPSPTTAQDVLEDLEGKIPLIIDGGPCLIGIESTVLNLTSTNPILLRPGSIKKEELEDCLKEKIFLPTSETAIHSPGMKYRHYAPKANVRLIFDAKDLTGAYVLSFVTQRNLYASLRRADRLKITEIEILCDQAIQEDAALMNRLLRASGQLM